MVEVVFRLRSVAPSGALLDRPYQRIGIKGYGPFSLRHADQFHANCSVFRTECDD
jgi:hypothetical protein